MKQSYATKIPTTAPQTPIFDFSSFERFQESKTNDDVSNEIINIILNNDKFEAYVKDMIEGIIFNQWTKRMTSVTAISDDPFDAIYIADLKPDFIHKKYIETLKYHALNIIDKSHELIIDDGWDD
jgi:hypothetical protein